MRSLDRNKRKFWYCTPSGTVGTVVDENGNRTGERITLYESALEYYANVSPARGNADTELFGNIERYDMVIVTNDLGCPLKTDTVLFVEKEPEYTEISVYRRTQGIAGQTVAAPVTYEMPNYDYIVVKEARSVNSVSYAIRKASVIGPVADSNDR